MRELGIVVFFLFCLLWFNYGEKFVMIMPTKNLKGFEFDKSIAVREVTLYGHDSSATCRSAQGCSLFRDETRRDAKVVHVFCDYSLQILKSRPKNADFVIAWLCEPMSIFSASYNFLENPLVWPFFDAGEFVYDIAILTLK